MGKISQQPLLEFPMPANTVYLPLRLLLAALVCLWLPLVSSAAETLTVHKSPTCGCCVAWLDQLSDQGYEFTLSHPTDLNTLKANYGIAPAYQSCHTAVSEQEYVFEGHIPGALIKRFLEEPPPGAIGLAVPGMPLGSPGMEVEDRFSPYQVLLLMEDGSSEVYAAVGSREEQASLGH
ncbi:MAG: DUF411 domain-containing protein [Porticoccaceae bacterium]|nr:DUF411 domain-containing protein [Porticoccaceae bacterium]